MPTNQKAVTILVRTIIIIVLLWIVSLIAGWLPMLRELTIPVINISASILAKTIISLAIIGVIWNFGREIAPEVQKLFPGWQESVSIFKYLVLLIVIVATYNALRYVAYGLIPGGIWAYNLIFVLLILYPLIQGGLILYRSMDKIVSLITGKTQHVINQVKDIGTKDNGKCPKCGYQNTPGIQFCGQCGTNLHSQLKKVDTENECPSCGAVNPGTSKFCVKCGTLLKK